MSAKKVIIEARLNEWVTREESPHVPWSPEEIAADARACREAGASIVHFHVRRPDGSPSHEPALYAAAVRGIRARSDILIHPTLAGVITAEAAERIAPLEALCRDAATRPDFAPMDMGSTNLDVYDAAAKRFRTDRKVYANSIHTLSFLGERIRGAGLKELLCVWTVPCLRTIDAFLDCGKLAEPALACLVLSEGGIVGGHPGTAAGLESLLAFMPPHRRIEWSVCCREGNVLPVAMMALARGGHVSIGLGDYRYPELGKPTNADLVREVVRLARLVGREPATPAEARAMLGMEAR